VDNDYQSECGKDAPSTVESLGFNNDRVHEKMKGVHMPTIDEDGDSVSSENLSTKEMLNRVYGNQPTTMTSFTDSLHDSGISADDMQQKDSSYITETKVDELLHEASYEERCWPKSQPTILTLLPTRTLYCKVNIAILQLIQTLQQTTVTKFYHKR